jgi:hypothetical protein
MKKMLVRFAFGSFISRASGSSKSLTTVHSESLNLSSNKMPRHSQNVSNCAVSLLFDPLQIWAPSPFHSRDKPQRKWPASAVAETGSPFPVWVNEHSTQDKRRRVDEVPFLRTRKSVTVAATPHAVAAPEPFVRRRLRWQSDRVARTSVLLLEPPRSRCTRR